jgi:secreted PhoX family phosphatase
MFPAFPGCHDAKSLRGAHAVRTVDCEGARMTLSRRTFIHSSTAALVGAVSMATVIASASDALARGRRPRPFAGYGELLDDPEGLIALPEGFCYRVFSREGEPLSRGGVVPSNHDGMAAFGAGFHGDVLVRNHEVEPEDVEEDGKLPVPALRGATYDPEGTGGTTTLLVDRRGHLLFDKVSLAGTSNNCAGGPTPWRTWLTCEETTEILAKPHGYVFEVDPYGMGNPRPIKAMGRFEHEAVAFDHDGRAYLTEDADSPFGCFYRFTPKRPLGGLGSLHAGGCLEAMRVRGLNSDLSIVQQPGSVFRVKWVKVPNVDPGADDTSVREQSLTLGATPIQKCEGCWTGLDGSVWFVASYGGGPDAEDEEDRSALAHAGQIWRYDPKAETIELVVVFPVGVPYDGPDNITVAPHGFALACNDGEDDQWLMGINEDGSVFPFALNQFNDSEFAGATFSPCGETLYVNIQEPGMTLAITGPWRGDRRGHGR